MNPNSTVTINNEGIISTGDNANNVINCKSTNVNNIDWNRIEKELEELRENSEFESIRTFAAEASLCVENKNFEGLKKCLKVLGTVGIEIISNTSASMLVEVIKNTMN